MSSLLSLYAATFIDVSMVATDALRPPEPLPGARPKALQKFNCANIGYKSTADAIHYSAVDGKIKICVNDCFFLHGGLDH